MAKQHAHPVALCEPRRQASLVFPDARLVLGGDTGRPPQLVELFELLDLDLDLVEDRLRHLCHPLGVGRPLVVELGQLLHAYRAKACKLPAPLGAHI